MRRLAPVSTVKGYGKHPPCGKMAFESMGESQSKHWLARCAATQRLAQDCLAETARALEIGQSESEVARSLDLRIRSAGASGYFHSPLVWFGERTRLVSKQGRDSLPSSKRLEPGMVVIMDYAPIIDGCAVDVSLTTALGREERVERGQDLLGELRALVPSWVREGLTARSICRRVNEWVLSHGCIPRQEGYLFGALGHRVYRGGSGRLSGLVLSGMGLGSGVRLLGSALLHRIPGIPVAWPFWNDSPLAEAPPVAGLWSMEPHFELDGIGIKSEELLVIAQDRVDWLADLEFQLS